MVQEKESRIKYIGQIITLFALEILMLLFRIALPVRANMGQTQWLIGEIIYMTIEGFLVIILVNHLIFKNAYSEMGLTPIKEHLFSLLGNLCYLGMVIGVTYGLNYISGEKNGYSISYRLTHTIVLFVSTAFLQETIFRGCILNSFIKLTRRKVLLSAIGATLLFMVIDIPQTMLQTNFESLFKGQTNQLIVVSFCMGIYLGLLYCWSQNVWSCIIIHGTYSCIDLVANGLLEPAFKGIYILGALIYLIYTGIQHRRGQVLVGEIDETDEADQVDEVDETNEADQVDEVDETDEADKTDEADQSKREDKNESANKNEEVVSSEDLSKTAIIPVEEQKKNLNIQKPHKNEDKKDLSQTTKIRLEALEAANKVDLNQTTIIKIAELEAAEKALKLEELAAHRKVKTVKFKEEPSYINHLEQALGEFENIYKQVIPTDPPIDILAFQGERFNALVTNGMRYLPMNVPEHLKGDAYVELVMFIDKSFDITDEGFLKEENSWLLQSLRDLAMYPRLTNSYIGWGHVVGNGEERMPYYQYTSLCGMLIYPPVMQEDMKFYTFKEGEKTTYIYNAMPLYTEEIDFILKYSSEAYFNRMREVGISQIIRKNRPSACLE